MVQVMRMGVQPDPFSGTPMLPHVFTPAPVSDLQATVLNHRLGRLEHALK